MKVFTRVLSPGARKRQNTMPPNLLEYKKHIFSQNGEDGIIEKIFEVIDVEHRTCFEVGAGDGIRFSNTVASTAISMPIKIQSIRSRRAMDVPRSIWQASTSTDSTMRYSTGL